MSDLTPDEKPPVKWSTIKSDATDDGLFAVVDEAMIGRKLTPSRRRLIVGNIVMAVAKWRESFRDCGCWKTEAGFALCDWHERAFRLQREGTDRLFAALAAAEARNERMERLAERGYWYFLMTQQGGPDGSDLDDAVEDDFLASLRGWADAERLPALRLPADDGGQQP